MKTNRETIKTKVYIYAEPKSKYQIENLQEGEALWTYRVKDYDYGDETSVRIMSKEIIVDVPDGIDITTRCISNLQEKIIAVQKQANKDVEDLRDRISKLALIEYMGPDSGEEAGAGEGDSTRETPF
jgi:hypothetical protein